jgi:3-hexulose-6-phosphate synthase/6-phospho-3-hexuloisomerase
LVVIGAPLAVDADAFRTADGNLEGTLRIICERVHGQGDVPIRRPSR